MKRISNTRKTRKAITLVELIVAMALTAMFATACIALILPITKIYTETNKISRSQLVADTVVDALRAECSKAIITSTGDVWLYTPTEYDGKILTDAQVDPSSGNGTVLVLRRNSTYCETIASNYVISDELVQKVKEKDAFGSGADGSGNVTSKSVYNISSEDAANGYIHYGYFMSGAVLTKGFTYIYPYDYFDYTSPYTKDSYMGYTVSLYFHDIKYDSNLKPVYVLCDVTVEGESEAACTRSVVLCFS